MNIFKHKIKLDKELSNSLEDRLGNTFDGDYLIVYSDKKDFNTKKDNFFFIQQKDNKFYLDLERSTFESVDLKPLENDLMDWMVEVGYCEKVNLINGEN
jgi:lipopolysaccharide export LptBFGC system permease protein LptF